MNSGTNNVIFGTGLNNTDLIYLAGAGASNTGSNNVAFGVNAGCSLTDGIHNILIGACGGRCQC